MVVEKAVVVAVVDVEESGNRGGGILVGVWVKWGGILGPRASSVFVPVGSIQQSHVSVVIIP